MNEEAGSEDQRARNVVRGIRSLTAQNFGTNLLGLVLQIALIRALSVTQYGVYSAIIVMITIVGHFAGMGLNQAVARYLSMLQLEDEGKSWVAARKILYLALVFTSLATLIYLLLSSQLSLYFTKTTEWTTTFALSGIWLFLYPITSLCQGIVQGLRRYTLLAKMIFVPKVVMVVFATLALLLYQSVDVAISAWIIYYVILILWTITLTGMKINRSKGQFAYSTILKYSYPLGIAATITIIATSADLVIVGGYLNPISLGVYNAAVTVSTMLTTVFVLPLSTAFLPELSRSNEVGAISNGVRLALRFLILVFFPASLFIASVSTQLIVLFTGGGVYLEGSSSLELISFFYLFYAIQMILVVMFQATGKTIYAMIIGLAAVASDIGVSVILVPRLDLLGAASAKVSVGLVGTFIGFYLGRKYLHEVGKLTFYGKSMVAAIIPSVFTFVLSGYVSTRVITLFPYAVVFGALFLACVKILKLLNDEDKALISHSLPKSLRRIVNYL